MSNYYFPINSSSLAHYFGSAIIKPAKYFNNKPSDIQDRFDKFLLFTNKFGTTETDCCLEIVLTDEEKKELISISENWFLYDVNPLPITRIRKIYFSDVEKRDVTITNIKMSTAYVPDFLVELHSFDKNSSESIQIPQDCNGVNLTDKIKRFDKFLGALALMKTAGESYMNYSPNYIPTLSLFNSLIKEQISLVKNSDFKNSYQGIFTSSKGFDRVLPYLNAHVDEEVLYKIAREEGQDIKKDKITRVIDINSISDNSWTYTIAFLNTYGVEDEARKKRIDGQIQSHFSGVKKEKAEGIALCYGYNRGYSVFSKDYGMDEKVSYKYRLDSQLDYYTIESVYQYVFNEKVASVFPYLDEWCPKQSLGHPKRRTDYIILDNIVIGKKRPKIFSDEWWNGIFPRFKEFGRLANVLFCFFKEVCEEMKEDIREEQEEIISTYENRINKYNEQIDCLTKKLNQQTEELNLLRQKVGNPNKTDNRLSDSKNVDLNKLKLPELKDLARRKGLSIPSKAKKDDIIRLLQNIETSTNDMFSQSNS